MSQNLIRVNCPSRAAKLITWLTTVVCASLAGAWFQYTAATHTGDRFERSLVKDSAARDATLARHAKLIAEHAGADPNAELLAEIAVALAQPTTAGLAPAVPVAHVLLLKTAVTQASLIEDLTPLVATAQTAVARVDNRRAQTVAEYRKALIKPWTGFWLKLAGYPTPKAAASPQSPAVPDDQR